MLASDEVARGLDGRLSRWEGRVQWFATSVVALSVWRLGLILAVAAGLGEPIRFGDRGLGLAARG